MLHGVHQRTAKPMKSTRNRILSDDEGIREAFVMRRSGVGRSSATVPRGGSYVKSQDIVNPSPETLVTL
jgi:hypothetical protein